MSVNIDNSNYGYSVATNKTYIVVGNPSIFAYSSSVFGTGSVEVLQYTNITDAYKHKDTIKKIFRPLVYIASETPDILMTDTGSNVVTSSQILYEYGDLVYTASRFGQSVAVYDTTLAVGDSLFYYKFSDNATTVLTGSGVDIFSLSGSISQTASYVTTIENTFESGSYTTNTSFGESVSLYNNILAIGASNISSSKGVVYLYKNISGTWTYYQTLTGSGTVANSKFGGVVKIDQSGSYNIIVGNKSSLKSNVYVFNYNSSSGYWIEGAVFSEDRSLALTQSLQEANNNWPPYITSSIHSSSFGHAVAIYGSSLIIGSPTDMVYFQYDGSDILHKRGAIYFYEDCTDSGKYWRLTQKDYGTAELLTTNYFGWDVELYNTSSVVTSLKTNWPFTQSYLENTLYKKYDCNPNDHEYNIMGQVVVYQKNTESLWNPITTLTKNKKYGESYSLYGYDAALYQTSIVIGSPTVLKKNDINSVTQSLSFVFINLIDDDGTNIGGVECDASGGIGPYTYLWEDVSYIQSNQTADTLINVSGPSDWQLTVTDNVGVTTSSIVHIYRAAYETQYADSTNTTLATYPSATTWNRNLTTIDQFNNSWGSLSGVTLYYIPFHRTNYYAVSNPVIGLLPMSWSLTSSVTSSLIIGGTTYLTASYTFGTVAGSSSLGTGLGIVATSRTGSANLTSSEYTDIATLNLFTGSGNLSVTHSSEYPTLVNNNTSSYVVFSTPQNFGYAMVSYRYTVPRQ